MKTLTRDDTVHGEEYVRKADALAEIDAAARMEWIAATDSKPSAGQKVIASYVNSSGKRRTVIARWVAAKTEESNENSDIGEYDEATDAYYDPEGWYECIDNWDDFTAIVINEGEVTHWMPRPAPPGAMSLTCSTRLE